AAVPVPAAVWLFGSGLLGLIGMAKRKKSIGSDSIDFTPGLKGL
ncbi:MAG: VPLPA-CTERM sorting domain-containing protein, partial [Gammaproteobacteria bacterium]|nr:VPLPA-CTERM sorting domain-containing protein [Gammaproteobacteria bacterium]